MTTKTINGVIYNKATICKTIDHAEKIAERHINNRTDAQVVKQGVSYAVYLSTGKHATGKSEVPIIVSRTNDVQNIPGHTPIETTVCGITPVIDVHEIGVEYAASLLAENGIRTSPGEGHGIDLVLSGGSTILVRAKSGSGRAALIRRSLDDLKSDYLIIVTNLETSFRESYIMGIDDVKTMAYDAVDKYGQSDYVLYSAEYTQYKDNYSIIKTGVNALPDSDYIKHTHTPTKTTSTGHKEREDMSDELRKTAEIEIRSANQRREAEYLARVRENN